MVLSGGSIKKLLLVGGYGRKLCSLRTMTIFISIMKD